MTDKTPKDKPDPVPSDAPYQPTPSIVQHIQMVGRGLRVSGASIEPVGSAFRHLVAMRGPTQHQARIYVVKGTCGQYEDQVEWTVCAYTDSHMALTHAYHANQHAKRISDAGGLSFFSIPDRAVDAAALIWDAHMQFSFLTNTTYSVAETFLRTTLPDVQE